MTAKMPFQPLTVDGHSGVPLEKIMTTDMLNINLMLVVVGISNSYCDGNGRHGHVANIRHLLYMCSNRVPSPGRSPAPRSPF